MKNIFRSALVVLALGVSAQVSQAALLYTCPPADASCSGNEYAVFVVSHFGNTYTLQVDIKITNSYTGNHWSDNVVALGIKGLPTFSSPSLVGAPGGLANWTLTADELNANGCNGGGSGGMCAEANAFAAGANVAGAGTILSWQFQFYSTATSITQVHLKYLYASGGTAANYTKAARTDLGSYNIPVQDGPDGDDPVPEPSTYAMIGITAVALGLWKRKIG